MYKNIKRIMKCLDASYTTENILQQQNQVLEDTTENQQRYKRRELRPLSSHRLTLHEPSTQNQHPHPLCSTKSPLPVSSSSSAFMLHRLCSTLQNTTRALKEKQENVHTSQKHV